MTQNKSELESPADPGRRTHLSVLIAAALGGTLASGAEATDTPTETPALGNPTVPGNPLRNYIFGPVPARTATGKANVGVGEAVLRNLTTGWANTAVGDNAASRQQQQQRGQQHSELL